MRLPPSEVPIAFTTLGARSSSSVWICEASVAMSTTGSCSGGSTSRMLSIVMVGKSPWRLTTISALPSGSSFCMASWMRSEPEGCSGRVITASPPWLVTTAAISAVSVATATRPIPAASARRMTCTIIGSPAISASGFAGRRVAAMRAGISTRMRASIIGSRAWKRGVFRADKWREGLKAGSLIRVARPRANRYLNGKTRGNDQERLIRPRLVLAAARPLFLLAVWGLAGNGLFRTQQDPRCRAWHLSHPAGDELHRPGVVLAQDAGKAGLRDRREGRGRRQGRRGRCGALRTDRKAAPDGLRREGRGRRQEVPRLPHLREGRAESRRSEPLRHRWRPPRRRPQRLQLLGGDEGQGRHLDHRRAEQVHRQS